jgi:serine protease Do
VMVVLVGSGHVAYGLGIERQIAGELDGGLPGRAAAVLPVAVRSEDGKPEATVRSSYADFVWGVPPETDPLFPSLGLSTAGDGEASRKVLFVSPDTPAARAGVQAGDVFLSLDGVTIPDRESLNRMVAAKRWGDAAVLNVDRGGKTETLTVSFRRQQKP